MENIELLKKHFSFLFLTCDFEMKEVESLGGVLFAKFISSKVYILFTYEFRDYVPRILIAKISKINSNNRPGLYTIKELYKDNHFKLQSFYLDEILSFQGKKEYKSYFQDIRTVEDGIKISAELLEKYAMSYVNGDDLYFEKLEMWFRREVNK